MRTIMATAGLGNLVSERCYFGPLPRGSYARGLHINAVSPGAVGQQDYINVKVKGFLARPDAATAAGFEEGESLILCRGSSDAVTLPCYTSTFLPFELELDRFAWIGVEVTANTSAVAIITTLGLEIGRANRDAFNAG